MAGLAQVAVLLVLLAAAWRPLGDWMARVYTDERDWGVERLVYRLVRVDPRSEQRASTYTVAILAFSFAGIVLLYLLQRLQPLLPWSFDRGTGASGGSVIGTPPSGRGRRRRESGARSPVRGRRDRGLRDPAARRPWPGPVVSAAANVIGGLVALGLLIYLVIALLRPEKF